MKSKRFTVKVKRKRQQRTDYLKRINYIKSNKPRLIIRAHTNNITLQVVQYEPKGDKAMVTVHSEELKKLGWEYHRGNIPTAYLSGVLLGTKAKSKNIKEAILDLGLQKSSKASRIYAALKGVVDAGVKVPHAEDVLPSKEKIEGKDIVKYAQLLQKVQERYKKQFASYIKRNINPEHITQKLTEVKAKILK